MGCVRRDVIVSSVQRGLKMKTKSFTRTLAVIAIAVISSATSVRAQVHPDDENRPIPESVGKMIHVSGRVVNAGGEPVHNAEVLASFSGYSRSARPSGVQTTNVLPAMSGYTDTVHTDADGRFSTQVVIREHGPYTAIGVIASAKGLGIGRAELNFNDGEQEVEVRLANEHLIRGRVVDLKGQPAVGAKVRIVEWGTKYPLGKLAPWNEVTTDDKGRFLLRGLKDRKYRVEFTHAKLAAHQEEFQAVTRASKEKVTVTISDAHTLYGIVTYEDSGNPVANAVVMAPQGDFGPLWQMTRTDAKGRYRINPFPPGSGMGLSQTKSYYLNVFPPNGEPLLVSRIAVPLSRAKSQEVDISLKSATVVVGRVLDEANRPLEGARIQYRPKKPGHDRTYMTAPTEASQVQVAITKEDGTYELGVPPGEGELLVLGPTLDFIPTETRRGVYRLYPDAAASLDVSAKTSVQTQDFQLKRGITLKARVTDSGGKPIESFELMSALCLASGYQPESSERCGNGYFELHGCDPKRTYKATILDKENQRGAALELSAVHANEPADIRLQPFGSAAIAFEDPAGQPTNARAMLSIVLHDGAPHRYYINVKGERPLEGSFLHFGGTRTPDKKGRLLLDDLIPGADYMVRWQPDGDGLQSADPWPHVHFSVKPGESLKLGRKVATKSEF